MEQIKIPYANLNRLYQTHRIEIDSAIQECLDNSYYIKGPKVKEFETKLTNYCKRPGVGVSSGTSALLLAYEFAGIRRGDKVLVPSFTFISTAEMLSKLGAIPIWLDCNLQDYTIDIQDLKNKINKDIKAIVCVDIFGHVCDYDSIIPIAQEYGIPIIQDAAQSFGGEWNGKINGSYNDITCFSFYPAKNLFCLGDGGAVVTDIDIAKRIKMASDHGRTEKYVHEFLGWNERLDAIQANILNKLIVNIDEWNQQRIDIAEKYDNNLKIKTGVLTAPYCKNVYNQYTIRTKNREQLIDDLKERGIECGIMWPLGLHQQPAYRSNISLPNTEKVTETILSLPCWPYMQNDEINYIIDNVNVFN